MGLLEDELAKVVIEKTGVIYATLNRIKKTNV
jgi:hypothetical protein